MALKTIPNDFLLKAYSIMFQTHQHQYLILTKRPKRMYEFMESHKNIFPIKHLWDGSFNNTFHGTTCENQQRAEERIPYLLQIPGKRFLSLEPLLGKIDLSFHFLGEYGEHCRKECDAWENKCPAWDCSEWKHKIHQVIVGAESGPHRRPCNIEWIRSIVQQCKDARVPCFVKAIHINGKGSVVKDINLFPEDLRVRELAWDNIISRNP